MKRFLLVVSLVMPCIAMETVQPELSPSYRFYTKTIEGVQKILLAGSRSKYCGTQIVRGKYLVALDKSSKCVIYNIETNFFKEYDAEEHGDVYWYPVSKIVQGPTARRYATNYALYDTQAKLAGMNLDTLASCLKKESSINTEELIRLLSSAVNNNVPQVCQTSQVIQAPPVSRKRSRRLIEDEDEAGQAGTSESVSIPQLQQKTDEVVVVDTVGEVEVSPVSGTQIQATHAVQPSQEKTLIGLYKEYIPACVVVVAATIYMLPTMKLKWNKRKQEKISAGAF